MLESKPEFTANGTPGTRGSCPVCGTTLYRMGRTAAHEGMVPPEVVKKRRNRKRKGKLVIVESPAKARTVGNFLGKGYTVKASVGHVRDLLKSQLSVDVENGFTPKYRVPNEKRPVVKELKKIAKNAAEIYLATDPDREGEAIAWHLYESAELEPEITNRVVFHEITKSAIAEAFDHPQEINMDLVDNLQHLSTDFWMGIEWADTVDRCMAYEGGDDPTLSTVQWDHSYLYTEGAWEQFDNDWYFEAMIRFRGVIDPIVVVPSESGPPKNSSGNLYIDWNDVSQTYHYRIYRGTEAYGSAALFDSAAVSNYTDNSGVVGNVNTHYFYQILPVHQDSSIYGKASKPLQNQIEVDLFLYTAVGYIVEKLEEEDLEHHLWPIGRSAEIWGICIPAKLIDEGEVDRFIQELEEVIIGDYTIVDMVAVEGKLV